MIIEHTLTETAAWHPLSIIKCDISVTKSDMIEHTPTDQCQWFRIYGALPVNIISDIIKDDDCTYYTHLFTALNHK